MHIYLETNHETGVFKYRGEATAEEATAFSVPMERNGLRVISSETFKGLELEKGE